MNLSFTDKHVPVLLIIVIAVVAFIALDLDMKMPEAELDARPPVQNAEFQRLVSFRDAARAAGIVFNLPQWPATPDAVQLYLQHAIDSSDERLNRIPGVEPYLASFRNTVQAFETAFYPAEDARGVVNLMAEVHPDEAMRSAAREALDHYSRWRITAESRDDVYRVIKTYADTEPPLGSEDERLLKDVMRQYRRNGMELEAYKRSELKRLRTELEVVENEFSANLNEADLYVELAVDKLAGIPAELLEEHASLAESGNYRINVNVRWVYDLLMKQASDEQTRHMLATARYQRAKDENLPLVKQMLSLRARIAKMLGYDHWADYRTEVAMAGTAGKSLEFQQQLSKGLQAKFEQELEALRDLKAGDTCDVDAEIAYWDVPYYVNRLKLAMFGIDARELKNYFPMDRVLAGIMDTFSELFGIEFTRVYAPERWDDALRLYALTDAGSGVPLGLLYMDLFPRAGKYNHFAHFSITTGKRLDDGRRQRPVSALVGNFPPPGEDRPSLLSLEDVETLFHEFGHALHALLSTASYARFSGTNVPADFVEVPSQLLEYWMRDKAVVEGFAVDYRDPQRAIPAEVLAGLKDARMASIALFERRQLAYSMIDTKLHMLGKPDKKRSLTRYANSIGAKAYLAFPDDTAMLASFGHLDGYDASYYGYAWSRAIASDLVSLFRESPDGLVDVRLGRRLYNEIFAPGSSRDEEYSIESFLGRKRSMQSFFASLGIEQ